LERSVAVRGWSVLDVLRHLIETQGLVAGFMDASWDPGRHPATIRSGRG
jgi:hypothetical protein